MYAMNLNFFPCDLHSLIRFQINFCKGYEEEEH